MPIRWREHIVSTPDVLRGKPRMAGTGIPVSLILGYLAAGYSTERIIYCSRWLVLSLCLSLAGLWLFGTARPTRADAAPISGLAGSDVRPVQSTGVEMVTETVLMEVWSLPFDYYDYNNQPGGTFETLGARVTADFLLNNPGASAESLTVGFPLYLFLTDSGDNGYFDIANLRAFVNGNEVTTQQVKVQGADWAAWEMNFSPGDTQLRVTYDVPATLDGCNAELGYILHTGAQWASSIGQADVIVRFGYPAEAEFNVLASGRIIQGFDVRWHFENFEPTRADDLALYFLNPGCWRRVLRARTALAAERSAENYWQLARLYAEIVYPHRGFYSPLMAQAADAQYRKAIELNPTNEELRTEFSIFLVDQTGELLPDSAVQRGNALLTQVAPTTEPTATRQPASPSPPSSPTSVARMTPTVRVTPTRVITATPQIRSTATAAPTATPQPSRSAGRGGCLGGAVPALIVIAGGTARWARRRCKL